MEFLSSKIKTKKANVAVIGLGYVGLPLLLTLSKLGFKSFGIDKNLQKVASLNSGEVDFFKNTPTVTKFLRTALSKKNFKITDDFSSIRECDFIFIAIDTPILKNRKPDLKNLIKVSRSIGRNIAKKSTVIVESTVSPGVSQSLIARLIEKESKLKPNKDFYVVVCSERVRPSHDVFKDLKHFPRVLGVPKLEIAAPVKLLYSYITKGEINVTDCITAEIVKTAENAYRDVKIAFINELAIICEQMGANVWGVKDLINKRYGREDMLAPGTGVGGHCIPKDPWLLTSAINSKKTTLIPAARNINDRMPLHLYELIKRAIRIHKGKIISPKLAILGYSYIENSEDARNSPTESLVKLLKSKRLNFKIHDPYVNSYSKVTLEWLLKGSDILILMVAHNSYKKLNLSKTGTLMRNKIIIDGKNLFDKEQAQKKGFTYLGVGNV